MYPTDPPRRPRIFAAPFDYGEHAVPQVVTPLGPLASLPVMPGATMPEMEPLAQPAAATPGDYALPDGGPGVQTAPSVDLAGYRALAPRYDDRRAGRLRTAGLVASLVGGGAALFGAGDSPLSALAQGVAGGAQRGLSTMDAEYATRSTAYADGLRQLLEKDADLVDRAAGRATTRSEGELNRTSRSADLRYAVDELTGRASADREATNERLRLTEAGDRLDLMVTTGTVEGIEAAAEAAGMDPTAARAAAAAVRGDLDREEVRLGRAVSADEARVVIARSQAAQGWARIAEDARHNRRTEGIAQQNADRPRAAGGGSGGGGNDDAARTRDLSYLNGIRTNYREDSPTYQQAQAWFLAQHPVPGATPASRATNPAGPGRGPIAPGLDGYDLTDPAVRSVLQADPVLRQYLP